ncbi:MAG: hypothetical protein HFE28_01075 [Clostridia bacterium]|jgi:hypothetical protein|nr:hypothetical protein [Clostridia bacterium]
MTKKQYYAIQAREREEREKKIRKDYPPAKVRAVLEEGLPDTVAAAKLGLNKTDFKILVTMYTLSGDI